jgi:exodeoxyribonuclease V alpha subunit
MALINVSLGPLERALLASLQRLQPQAPEAVLACAALCSEALASGDVCLPLARVAARRPWAEFDFALPALAELRALLESSTLVGTPGAFAPLILEGERLYLARYQAYEQRLAERLLAMSAERPVVDEAVLAESLARLFAFNQQQR